jgi:predicted nucleic acid-binding Zn ribbon protein
VRRRAPRPAATAVEALAHRLRPATPLGAVQAAWEAAVGSAIAREARPVGERAGTVTVACSSSVWAQEVQLLGPALVEALNRELGAPRVQALSCGAGVDRRSSFRDLQVFRYSSGT